MAIGTRAAGDPATDPFVIVPSNAADLPRPIDAIRCRPDGTAGEISGVTLKGNAFTTAIAVGETLPYGWIKINSTGTTATGLEGI